MLPVIFAVSAGSSGTLEGLGYAYGAVLQIQVLIDAFILVFALLLRFLAQGRRYRSGGVPRGRGQPMFWLLCGIAFAALTVSPFIPYWTFGEDHLVVREIGYDTILLVAAVFGTLAASMSISEEIEGRTAVTLMSKPVSRLHFLVGKFIGIALASGVLFALLGTYFEGVTLFKPWWDKKRSTLVESRSDHSLSKQVEIPRANVDHGNSSIARGCPACTTDLLRGLGLWTHLMITLRRG